LFAVAKELNAEVFLRIEDHDKGRSRQEYINAICEDLEWLGFRFDGGISLSNQSTTPFLQSNRHQRYLEVYEQLSQRGLIYKCDCSRKAIFERTGKKHPEIRYDGYCRNRQEEIKVPHGVRIQTKPLDISFEDVWLGDTTQNPADQCGDWLIKDRDGQWTYQFAVVVDDIDQDINLVIRGEDLYHATARQIQFWEILSSDNPPVYGHHPLLKKDSGEKLSKRQFDSSIRQERKEGVSPEALLAAVAQQMQLIETGTPISLDELIRLVVQGKASS